MKKRQKNKIFRYQIQMSLRVAQLMGPDMSKEWVVHGDNIFKNVSSFKKAKAIFAKLPTGAKLIDKKKKLYWIKGVTHENKTTH